jgi:predicted RNA binding protein YcfA (HicA-like mRNA interferase family)
MSKAEKALQKVLSGASDNNITYEELTAVLAREGFLLVGGKGSHQVWARESDQEMLSIPRHGNKIKPIYVKKARELLKP